jgi:phosphate uptake regulator
METRKVQVTGGSTYTVSIPKRWATDHDVSGGTIVALFEEDDTLLVQPHDEGEPSEVILDVGTLEGAALLRAVTTLYMSGFDVVTLEAPRVTAERRQTVRRATRRLVGFEVVEETSDTIRLRDLLDQSELSVRDATVRAHRLSTAMLADAVEALREGDEPLAGDVVERDDDVDRLRALVERAFRTSLRDPKVATEAGLTQTACFDHQQCIRQYERVADHAEKLATLTEAGTSVPDPVAGALTDLHETSTHVVELATESFFETDGDRAVRLANEAREENERVAEVARDVDAEVRTLDPSGAGRLGLAVDSLSRVADYGGNVAEVALQRALPAP